MGELTIQIMLSLATAVIGFVVGVIDNKINLKREVQKERLYRLYIPFVRLYDKTHMAGAYNFLDLSNDVQKQFIELLVDNMVYSTKFTKGYIVQFMMIYHPIFKEGKLNDVDEMELNKTFNTICELIYEEFNYLENKFYFDIYDRVRNYLHKKKFRKYASNDAMKNALMNNL